MSNFAANPFALLEDESAEIEIVEAAPQTTQKNAKIVQKKIPLKETISQPAAALKPVLKKTGKAPIKDAPFEEAPEHKIKATGAVVDKEQKGAKKREFDRRSAHPKSGDGREKKETSGKASWGNELDAQLENAEGVALAADEQEVAAAVPEPEESFKSLAEYKAEKEAARAAAALVDVRKPNEGVDESQWKKLTPLVKDDKIEEFMFAGKAPKEKERKIKEKPVKTVLEITQTFAPAPKTERSDKVRGDGKPRGASSTGGPRGGRGEREGAPSTRVGGRGANGRGGKGPVNVMDQNAFPSLSS